MTIKKTILTSPFSFLDMEYAGLKLDKFQEEAIAAIMHNKSVVVSAPTGSGKTLIADYIIDRDYKTGARVIYTAPIKALSNQKFKDFVHKYGEEHVGLITGDVVKNPDAPIVVMTTEIYRNMAITKDESIANVSYVIFDEIHYINDLERGYVWEESIIFSSDTVRMLCLSATIPNAAEFASWIKHIKHHEVVVVRHEARPVPLHVAFFDSDLGVASMREIKEHFDVPDYKYIMGTSRDRRYVKKADHTKLVEEIRDKLPALFFSFSRDLCQKMAKELLAKNLFEMDQRIVSIIRDKLKSSPHEINRLESVMLLRQTLPYGIGFHHAGLIPVVKELVEELFSLGFIKVLYATETFALGVNMPAKSVCLQSIRKYDGTSFRLLNSKEYFQMAGRAGRRGIDDEGFVFIVVDLDFEPDRVKRLIAEDKEPIKSQFRLSINTALNLIRSHTDEETEIILSSSFDSFQKSAKNPSYTFERMKKELGKKGFVTSGRLTEKGEFASKIYSDELILSDIFASSLVENLNTYEAMLIFACLCIEARESVKFYKVFPSRDIKRLRILFESSEVLHKEKRFSKMEDYSALMHPCYKGETIFDLLKYTNMTEGDILRIFRQMFDRMNQVKNASRNERVKDFMTSCQEIIQNCISGVDGI